MKEISWGALILLAIVVFAMERISLLCAVKAYARHYLNDPNLSMAETIYQARQDWKVGKNMDAFVNYNTGHKTTLGKYVDRH